MASENKSMVYKLCDGKVIREESKVDADGRTHYEKTDPTVPPSIFGRAHDSISCDCRPYDSRDVAHTFVFKCYDEQMECYCYECKSPPYTTTCHVSECYYPRWYNKKKERFSLTCSRTCAKKIGTWRRKIN